jgi:hypothetical protein
VDEDDDVDPDSEEPLDDESEEFEDELEEDEDFSLAFSRLRFFVP